jgi:predicted PurR-regulated permease PerM
MSTDKIIKGLATLVVVALILAVVYYLWQVVVYVVVAAVLAIVGRPLVRLITRVKLFGRNISRTIAAAFTLVVIWIVGGALLSLFIPLVFNKVYELSTMNWDPIAQDVRQVLIDVQTYVDSVAPVNVPRLEVTVRDMVNDVFDVEVMKDVASSVAGYVGSVGIAFFSISFITFFFLREDGLFYNIVALFFPENYRKNVYHALDSITKLLSRYFVGLLVESFVLMVVISVVLMLFGMSVNDALIIGLVMGVMNVIPYAGPFMGTCLSTVIAMLSPIDGNILFTVIVLLSTIVVIKVIDDFIIQPTLYSERVQAHPLEVFLVILIAGTIGGMWGMLFAIPLYTILRVFAREFFSEYSVVRKLTSQMTK